MVWNLSRALQESPFPLVMGVLNVTPDSFSDGGLFSDINSALRHAEKMLAEGANIIDLGGESTRPGAVDISADEEIYRVIPVLKAISRELQVPVSVDTSKPEVMRAAIDAGAAMINDVKALQELGALEVLSASGVSLCLMHMQGTPRTMQTAPQYDDVVEDIIHFLLSRVNACVAAGIEVSRIAIDPGFGFGKTLADNFTVLGHLDRFSELGYPVLAGFSRKSMLGQLLDLPVAQRVNASSVVAALAAERGVSILRVHDVRETVEAVRLVAAMKNPEVLR